MRIFVIYTDFCFLKVQPYLKKNDILFLDYRVNTIEMESVLLRFTTKSTYGRIKFYYSLKKYLLNSAVSDIFFHNYTDYSFYLIYNILKYRVVNYHYVSDGLGSFLSRGINLKRVILMQFIFFIQKFEFFEVPPFNFLICFNVRVLGKEPIELILNNQILPELNKFDRVLLLDNYYFDILEISEKLKILDKFSQILLKLHPLKDKSIKQKIYREKEIIFINDYFSNEYDLCLTFNSTSVIELLERKPSLRVLVIFPYLKEYERFKNVVLYEESMFRTWNKKHFDSITVFANYKFEL
jgi:hypothetical protein